MRVLMTEDSNNPVSNSFLLDDDSRLLSFSYQSHILSEKNLKCFLINHPHFEMQHTVLRWWHIQINAADWYLWYWTTPTHSGELWLCILIATPWIKCVVDWTKLRHGMHPGQIIGQSMQNCRLSIFPQWPMKCSAQLPWLYFGVLLW
jgi:hypothetical protein